MIHGGYGMGGIARGFAFGPQASPVIPEMAPSNVSADSPRGVCNLLQSGNTAWRTTGQSLTLIISQDERVAMLQKLRSFWYTMIIAAAACPYHSCYVTRIASETYHNTLCFHGGRQGDLPPDSQNNGRHAGIRCVTT
jgi:hypothetical protein